MTEESIEKAFSTIERNARSQGQLIEDLLDVSRIISGKVRLDIQPVVLTKIIEAAFDSIKPAADAKNISLQKILGTQTTAITGDSERLQQIVWNLLSNAIKFTPRNGRVQVKLEQTESYIEIIVTDTGKGIAPNFLPFVFDRFRQADSSSKREFGGLGLGLSIVRHLTELHGGTVEVFSEGEDTGTTFTIKLPRNGNVQNDEKQYQPPTAQNAVSENIPTLSGIKALIVDDDEDARILLALVLEQSEARVTAVSSVSKAIEYLKNETFDLLISDIEMPLQDGYDLIQIIRATPQNKTLPAIAVTAYARAEDRIRSIAAGFDSHISKPVEPQALLKAVATLVDTNRKNQNI